MKSFLGFLCLALACSGLLYAEEKQTAQEGKGSEKTESVSPWNFSLATDLACHPETAYVAGDSHFAPTSGFNWRAKARARFTAAYTLPVLTGDNPLFSGNHLTFAGSFCLTPVSFSPDLSITFSPAAFFDLSASFTTGSGWNIGSLYGIREYNPKKGVYDELPSLRAWYMKGAVAATIKFDVGALWPGDWHHIVGMASFEVGYQSLLGASQTVWEWQTFAGHADGWVYQQYYVIGYQMPMKFSMIAMTFDLTGHFSASDYGSFADNYRGDFLYAEIGPMFEFDFNKNNELYVLIAFTGRRSFKESHTQEDVEPGLTYSGREWLLDYFAFRWIHYF